MSKDDDDPSYIDAFLQLLPWSCFGARTKMSCASDVAPPIVWEDHVDMKPKRVWTDAFRKLRAQKHRKPRRAMQLAEILDSGSAQRLSAFLATPADHPAVLMCPGCALGFTDNEPPVVCGICLVAASCSKCLHRRVTVATGTSPLPCCEACNLVVASRQLRAEIVSGLTEHQRATKDQFVAISGTVNSLMSRMPQYEGLVKFAEDFGGSRAPPVEFQVSLPILEEAIEADLNTLRLAAHDLRGPQAKETRRDGIMRSSLAAYGAGVLARVKPQFRQMQGRLRLAIPRSSIPRLLKEASPVLGYTASPLSVVTAVPTPQGGVLSEADDLDSFNLDGEEDSQLVLTGMEDAAS